MQKEWDGIYKTCNGKRNKDLIKPIKRKKEGNKAIKKHSKYRGKRKKKNPYTSLIISVAITSKKDRNFQIFKKLLQEIQSKHNVIEMLKVKE